MRRDRTWPYARIVAWYPSKSPSTSGSAIAAKTVSLLLLWSKRWSYAKTWCCEPASAERSGAGLLRQMDVGSDGSSITTFGSRFLRSVRDIGRQRTPTRTLLSRAVRAVRAVRSVRGGGASRLVSTGVSSRGGLGGRGFGGDGDGCFGDDGALYGDEYGAGVTGGKG